jgi:hypothetical protein
MTRFLRAIFVILSAVVCSGISSCGYVSASGATIPAKQVERGLRDYWPILRGVHIEDTTYSTVSDSEVWEVVKNGWKPAIGEGWDCDDQAASALHALRVSYYGRPFAPASGRLSGIVHGQPHAAIWWVNHDGQFRFVDATTRSPLSRDNIQPWRCYDK